MSSEACEALLLSSYSKDEAPRLGYGGDLVHPPQLENQGLR